MSLIAERRGGVDARRPQCGERAIAGAASFSRTGTVARGGRTDDRWTERRDRLIIVIAACLGIGGAALGHWLTVVAMA